jgi:hypothetical protein
MTPTDFFPASRAVSKFVRGACGALAIAAVASVVVPGAASAQNLVTNGQFAITNPTTPTATSFSFNGAGAYGGPNATPESLAGWNFVWADAGNTRGVGFDVVNGQINAYWQGSTTQLFASAISAPVGGNFLAIDANFGGASQPSGVTQAISGLTVGASYTLSFSYSLAQWYAQGAGPDTAAWTATLFGASRVTPTLSVGTNGITGWATATFTYVANATSTTLSLLSSPSSGVPPLALLANVQLTKAPEPAGMALFGTGIAALMVVARKRRMAARRV